MGTGTTPEYPLPCAPPALRPPRLAAPGRAERTLLVGDIGGSSARLALVSPSRDEMPPLRRATMPSRSFAGVRELIEEFLDAMRTRVDGVVLAVAGPVVERRATLSNLGWVVDAEVLRAALDVPYLELVNDLVATAHAVPGLTAEALCTLQEGRREPGGAIAIVAPGTGLGEALATWDGVRDRSHPSEGGHADFAPTDPLQMELLDWMEHRVEHVSYERVCSGRALPVLYDFLLARGHAREAVRTRCRLAVAADRTPVIVEAALREEEVCPLSRATVRLFADILAAEAGNAALRAVATGGVYLAGGLPRRVLPVLTAPEFLARFRRKGRLAPLLERIPLHVVTRTDVPLLGAMRCALAREQAAVRTTV